MLEPNIAIRYENASLMLVKAINGSIIISTATNISVLASLGSFLSGFDSSISRLIINISIAANTSERIDVPYQKVPADTASTNAKKRPMIPLVCDLTER